MSDDDMNNQVLKHIWWPKKEPYYFLSVNFNFTTAAILVLTLISSLFSPAYSYYEVREDGRPRSAYSICCCKQQSETNIEILYSCQYLEASECPDDTKEYHVAFGYCPDNLIYRKYNKKVD